MNLLLGATFDTWDGCYSSFGVVLACVAINGYHGVSSYLWEHNGDFALSPDTTPLLSAGSYVCSKIMNFSL